MKNAVEIIVAELFKQETTAREETATFLCPQVALSVLFCPFGDLGTPKKMGFPCHASDRREAQKADALWTPGFDKAALTLGGAMLQS